MNTPGGRLKYWIEKVAKTSVTRFAEEIGAEHKTLYVSIDNKVKSIIGRATREKIVAVYPNFPWAWISTGAGDMPDEITAARNKKEEVGCIECRLKDMEIQSLRKEAEGLHSILEAGERNQKRLEDLIVHYEKMYTDCSNELEKYKNK